MITPFPDLVAPRISSPNVVMGLGAKFIHRILLRVLLAYQLGKLLFLFCEHSDGRTALSQRPSKQHSRIQRTSIVSLYEVGFDPFFKQSELDGSRIVKTNTANSENRKKHPEVIERALEALQSLLHRARLVVVYVY